MPRPNTDMRRSAVTSEMFRQRVIEGTTSEVVPGGMRQVLRSVGGNVTRVRCQPNLPLTRVEIPFAGPRSIAMLRMCRSFVHTSKLWSKRRSCNPLRSRCNCFLSGGCGARESPVRPPIPEEWLRSRCAVGPGPNGVSDEPPKNAPKSDASLSGTRPGT